MSKEAKIILLAAAAAVLAAGAWWLLGREAAGPEAAGAGAAREAAIGAPSQTLYNCAMHPNYISDKPGKCPFCGMDLTPTAPPPPAAAPSGAAGGGGAGAGAVRIDPAVVQNIGVRTEPVGLRDLADEVRASGRVTVDESRQYDVNARVSGWAERLHAASTGQAVRKGEILLDLYSPDLVSAQEEYLQALRYAGAASGGEGGAAGGPAAEARRAAGDLLSSARRRLSNWGFPEGRIAVLERRGAAERTMPIVSPASGVVLEKQVLQGQSVSPGMPLYRIADLSRVWVVASIYQADLGRVRVGSPAEITLSYLPGKVFSGQVAFVSPVLDPETRTAEVRVEVANTASLDLKPEMFASVTLAAHASGPVVAVPEQAIIRSGRRNLAIVSLGQGYFEPRELVLGRSAGGWSEVLEGLSEGESLVVSSQFLIDSESNLKAAIQRMQARGGGGDAAGAASGGADGAAGSGDAGAGGGRAPGGHSGHGNPAGTP